MKRSGLSHFSGLSIALTAVFFLALGLALWLRGGLLFNPGPVTAAASADRANGEYGSHAEFERECSLCHQPLAAAQADLCMDCHRTVQTQVVRRSGLHGRLPVPGNCAECHAEHQGRQFDPLESALAAFDHTGLTALPLEGRHAEIECADCHPGGRHDQARATCMTCHADPAIHAGLFGQDCAACHSAAGWQPALWEGQPFDHGALRFTLARHAAGYDGEPLACAACHAGTGAAFQAQSCADCHGGHDAAFMGGHEAEFGSDCLACHDGADRMSGFRHEQVFVLEGRHAALECRECHAGGRFADVGTECVSCHAEPDIHAGAFGVQCELCHSAQAWQPALLSSHSFPLDHGEEGEIACQTCHTDSFLTYTCTNCHEHTAEEVADDHREENISAAELARCADCHPQGEED